MQEIIDGHTEPWGGVVSVVEVKDLDLPETMERSTARQAKAERMTHGTYSLGYVFGHGQEGCQRTHDKPNKRGRGASSARPALPRATRGAAWVEEGRVAFALRGCGSPRQGAQLVVSG